MTETAPLRRRLVGISPKAYEHPADRAATAALKSIPGMEAVVRKLIEFGYERTIRQSLMAASVRLGPDQMPDIWQRYETVVATLDMPETYALYVAQQPTVNAMAIGSKEPMIVVLSGSISLFDDDELDTVLAHEVGHIHSDHVLYRTALFILLQLMPLGRIPSLAGLPLLGIRAALLEWFRAAELSCDRAATLVNRDPLTTARTLMVMAGGISSKNLNLDAFLRQGQEFKEWGSTWDRFARLRIELNLTHSFPVRRVSELMDWVRSGEYDRIIDGDYRKRDQPVDPKEEAGGAYDHYRDRFKKSFEEAGETFERGVQRIDDWLKSRR